MQREQEHYSGMVIANSLEQATDVLRQRIDDFSERVAANYSRYVDRIPPNEFSAGWESLWCYICDHATGELPDFDRIADELAPHQPEQPFDSSLINFESIGLPPRFSTKTSLLLERFPPFFVVVSDEYLDNSRAQHTLAMAIDHSNVIAIRESTYREMSSDDFQSVMVHETLHYIARAFRQQDVPHWLDEGCTEYLAQTFCRRNGISPSHDTYSRYTHSTVYLARIVGDDTLAEAYLTGDFSEVQIRVDRIGGFGTFDRIMNVGNYEDVMRILGSLCEGTSELDQEVRSWGKQIP
ncbi:hypothetical protein KKB44_02480 [Candidatus Micrarchaeota archaeon]|nr:hypothetical protein [Candidatus Micrarchaeota archaeon]